MRKIHAPLARQNQKCDKSCSPYIQKERLCLRDFSCHSFVLNLVSIYSCKAHPFPSQHVISCRFMLLSNNLRNTEKVFNETRGTVSKQIYFTTLPFKNKRTQKCRGLIAITTSAVTSRNVRENSHWAI